MSLVKKALCIGVITTFISTSLALAGDEKNRIINGPMGFDNRVLSSVISIQNHGKDDDLVCLRGRLTNYIGKKSYEFTDLDGNSIEVELDDDCNWNMVHKNQLIEIFGEVERNMFVLAIDAKDFNILEEPAQFYTEPHTAQKNDASMQTNNNNVNLQDSNMSKENHDLTENETSNTQKQKPSEEQPQSASNEAGSYPSDKDT